MALILLNSLGGPKVLLAWHPGLARILEWAYPSLSSVTDENQRMIGVDNHQGARDGA